MKRVCLSLLVVMVVLLSFAAWAQTSAKPLELKYAGWTPPTAGIAKIHQKMLDMITEKTQGKVKITAYFGETLLKMPELFRGVQSGVADMGYWVVGGMGSPEKLSTIIHQPFNGITSMEMGTAVTEKLFRSSPEIMSEYKGLEVLGLRMMSLYHAHTVKKPVRVPADMKGMKVIASAGWAEFVKLINAAPVVLGPGDWYMSLERGLVEAQFIHFPASFVFKTIDIHKHHTMISSSSSPDCMFFNKNTWDSLSPDIQKAIKEAVQWRTAEAIKFNVGEEERNIEYAKKRGNTFYTPNADEMRLWYEAAKPLHEIWVTKYEKEGLPARKIFDRLNQIVNEYKK